MRINRMPKSRKISRFQQSNSTAKTDRQDPRGLKDDKEVRSPPQEKQRSVVIYSNNPKTGYGYKGDKGGDPRRDFEISGGVRRFDKTNKVTEQRTVNKSKYESPEHERFKKSISKKLPRREVINPRNR